MALDALFPQGTMDPEAIKPGLLDDDDGNDFPLRADAFCLRSEKRVNNATMSPAGTACFDIFSPLPGDSDVINQVERLNSIEMKIAPISVRIAFGVSCRLAATCMVVSRVGVRNLTLPERRSLSTSP